MSDTKNFRYYAGGLELEIRPVKDEDYALIHRWRTAPGASFWGSTSVTKTEVYDRYTNLNPGEAARILSVVRPSGKIIPVGFLLFYCPDRSKVYPALDYDPYHDALAQQYVSDPDDGGCHILLSSKEDTNAGFIHDLGAHAIRAAAEYLRRTKRTTRFVAAPDLRNTRAIERFVQAGYIPLKIAHLPNKTALILVCFSQIPLKRRVTFKLGMVQHAHLLIGRIGRKLGLIERCW